MSLQAFFDSLAPLTNGPNGVAKMKTLVINLAVRGKLQIDNDNSRSLGSKDDGPRVCDSIANEPYTLPSHWLWCLLDDAVEILDYKREPISEEERNLRTAGKSAERLYPYYGATQQTGWIDDYIFDEELVLLGEDGVPFFDPDRPKAYLVSGKCWVNNHAHVLRGVKVHNRFLLHYLNVFDYSESITGTTRLKLNQARMKTIPIPIPPLEEQKQIVGKVDELMRLCDELKARQQAERESRLHLNNVTITPLNNAASLAQDEFEQASFRLADNFVALYDSVETVGKLRSTILQLAVQGKLVPQGLDREPAVELIEKINTRKAKLIKEKRIGKSEPLPPLEPETIPAHLPKGWSVERLGNLVLDLQNGVSKRKSEIGEPTPVLRLADIKDGQLSESSLREIRLTSNEVIKYKVTKGDIIIIRVNGSAALVGRFVPCLVDRRWTYSDHLIRARLPLDLLDHNYLCLFANSSSARNHLTAKTITTAGQKTINQSGLSSLPVWLPPLEEQNRIVAKVNHLMALCDELETKLRQAETDIEKLMNAAVQHVLETISEATKPIEQLSSISA